MSRSRPFNYPNLSLGRNCIQVKTSVPRIFTRFVLCWSCTGHHPLFVPWWNAFFDFHHMRNKSATFIYDVGIIHLRYFIKHIRIISYCTFVAQKYVNNSIDILIWLIYMHPSAIPLSVRLSLSLFLFITLFHCMFALSSPIPINLPLLCPL